MEDEACYRRELPGYSQKEVMEGRLKGLEIVAILIHGKSFREDEIIIAIGVTAEGRRAKLGLIQVSTGNGSGIDSGADSFIITFTILKREL
jgi:hypothetical protein